MLFLLNSMKRSSQDHIGRKKISLDTGRLELPKHRSLRRTSSLSQLDIDAFPIKNEENKEKPRSSKPPRPAGHGEKATKTVAIPSTPKSNRKMKQAISIGEEINKLTDLTTSLLYVEISDTGEMLIRQGRRPSPPKHDQKEEVQPTGPHEKSKAHHKLLAMRENKKSFSTTNLLHRFHIRKAKPEESDKVAESGRRERASSAELSNDGGVT